MDLIIFFSSIFLKEEKTFVEGLPIIYYREEKKILFLLYVISIDVFVDFLVVIVVKSLPASAGVLRDIGLIPGSGRSLGGRHDNPLQCFCLENPWTEESGRLQSLGSHRVRHN